MSQKTRTTVVIKLTNSLLFGMNIFLQIMAIVLFINNLNAENPIGLIYDLILIVAAELNLSYFPLGLFAPLTEIFFIIFTTRSVTLI